MFKKIITLLMVLCMLVSCALPVLADTGRHDSHSKQPVKVEKPVISPRAGIYDSSQTVTISCATPGATIHYTINGINPQKNSTVYTGPITISKTSTIIAYAEKKGMKDSEMAAAAYIIMPKVAAPKFCPAPGIYNSAQTVTLSCDTKNAVIKYTLDGSDPNIRSKTYTAPIAISTTTTVKAYVVKNPVQHSEIVTAVYTIKAAAPTFSLQAGKYGSAQTVELTSSTKDATIRYTLDGSTPDANSAVYTGPITVEETTTINAYVTKTGMMDSDVASATYEIDPWTLVWQDEFDGTSVDTTKWYLEDKGDGFGNNEQQYYSPSNAVVKDGVLQIQAEKVDPTAATNNKGYTSAKLMTVGKADWKYGKFEARIKLPLGQGFWPAFWMMPANDTYGGWAASGEMDIMEARGRIPDTVSGTLHYGGVWPSNKYTGHEYKFTDGQDISTYHTYSMEWEPGEIRWYVDGVLYQTQNNWNTYGSSGEEKYAFPAPFDQPFYLILNLAIGGNFDGGVVPDTSKLPAEMDVDYVRVYELSGRPYKTVVEPSTDAGPLPDNARPADATGNLVYDVNYANGITENAEGVDANFGNNWNFVHNAAFGAVSTASVVDIGGKNFAKVDVTNAGNQPYAVQLEQLVTLGKGRWYTFSFDAKADNARTLVADLGGGPTAGWAKYSNSYTVNLTSDVQHYSYTFQMAQPSDVLTRIEFNCATTTGPVYIGNVRVEEIPAPVVDYTASRDPLPVSGNLVYNGAFDKYTIDRMSYWNVTKTDADATVSVPEATRVLTTDISDGGETADALTVDQRGLKLYNGNDYMISFKARAAAGRTIGVKITNADGSTEYLAKDETLTTGTQTFEIPFKMTSASDNTSKLVFLLGGNDSDVYVDDVSIVQTTVDYSGVVMYPLQNGDFSKGLDSWTNWVGEGGSAAISVENGEARVSVTGVGNQPYSTQFMQENMSFTKGMQYVVEFDARSTVKRNIEYSVENSGYTRRSTAVIEVGPQTQHFSYTFTAPVTETMSLKFLLGKTDANVTPSDIYIDNVVLEVKDAKFLTSVVKNGQFTTGLQPWEAYTGDGGAAEVDVENGEMKIGVSSVGANSYAVQAYQQGLKFVNGKSYILTFKARADADRRINVNIGKALTSSPWFTPYMPMQTFDLTATMETYTCQFTMGEPTYDNAKIVFEAGNVAGGNTATNVFIDDVTVNEAPLEKIATPAFDVAGGTYASPQTVAISCETPGVTIRYTTDGTNPTSTSAEYVGAISITESTVLKAAAFKSGMIDSSVATATYAIGGDIVQNGTFGASTSFWNIWGGDGGAAVFNVVDDAAKIDISGIGPNNWSVQFYQDGVQIQSGKTYELSLKASSTVDRPIQVEFTGYKGNESVKFNLTSTPTVYKYDLSVPGADSTFKLNFLIGNVINGTFTTPTGAHTLTIDDISIREVTVKDAPALTADPAAYTNQDAHITFADDAAWRAAISDVKVDGTSLAPSGWSVSEGILTLSGTKFTSAKDYTIVVVASGFKNAQIIQTLAVDPASTVPPVLTADPVNNLVGRSITLTFADDAKWRDAITSVKVNGSSSGFTTLPGTITIDAGQFAAAGDYTIIVAAQGYDNAQVTQTIWQEAGENLLADGTFSTTADFTGAWKIHNQGLYEQWAGKADFSIAAGIVEANVVWVGWEWWHIQLYQDAVTVPAGTYKISFDMSSEAARPAYVELSSSGAPIQTFNVDSTLKTYSAIINVSADGSYKFMFGLGRGVNDPTITTTPYKIQIDNVKLVKVTK